ncbi:MAG TPA: type II toxin-antitoxin system HipA family toxin [Gammaproteobacteria bacterium]|nr:type II toxin-antitoxin system HipA family toxin [Gammaproteobacteria bacterium]
MTVAEVELWGTTIGAVALAEGETHASFQYAPDFLASGIEVAPLMMPLSPRPYRFPELSPAAFHGLPGLLADSLPDKFGNALIDAWLATQGRPANSFNAVERLCYIGSRGTGALEFRPATGPAPNDNARIEVDALVRLASEILTHRSNLHGRFSDERHAEKALLDILRVGTSAGGARAKALIAWNPETNEVRSGQIDAGKGFEYWLLKFDGVSGNRDREMDDPQGYGQVEYACHLMAVDAGINMSDCRLMQENGRHHFMTKRFDRLADGTRVHMQSLAALAHFDYNLPGAYSYEQAIQVIRRLGLGMEAVEQQFRRMIFNLVIRNQDDHVKNIAFLMDKSGQWTLSPAFDVAYSYNPQGQWTSQHQMSVNGKRDGFTREDLRAFAKNVAIKRGRADGLLDEILDVARRWPEYAARAGVKESWIPQIGENMRLEWPEK